MFRSAAEEFVTQFIDYVDKYDILDELNKRTNKMERSPGVEKLIRDAKKVFPERKPKTAGAEMTALSEEERMLAIAASANVVDTREMFSRKIQENGGVREMLRRLLDGDDAAREEAREFFKAENGRKEFYVTPKE
jgi:hypothetical protein